jgi:hypothetical protein
MTATNFFFQDFWRPSVYECKGERVGHIDNLGFDFFKYAGIESNMRHRAWLGHNLAPSVNESHAASNS